MAVCLDECHRVKNNDAQQTQAIKSLIKLYTVILSGTPVANKPQDVFEPVQMIAPNLLGFTSEHFKKTYAWTDTYENVTSYKKGALDEIHNRMAVVSVRVLRKDAHLELGKIIEPQMLECPEKLKKVYDRAKEDFVLELSSASDRSRLFISNFLARLVRLQQLTDGYLPRIDATGKITGYAWLDESFGIPNVKIKFIDEWINDYLYNGAKLVIYSRFVPVLQKLYNRYKKYNARLIYGETKANDVDRYQTEFRGDPDCRLMICNTVCSEGKDFNPCQFVIFYDRVWGLKDNTQAEDRVTGINQVQESTIMPLVIKDTIDFTLETVVLPKKRADAAKVEDGIGVAEPYTIEDLFSLLK